MRTVRLGFDAHPVGERGGEALVDDALVRAHHLGHARPHVLRQGAARRQQLGGRHDAIHQAPRRRLLGREVVAGERQLLGAVDADRARQLLAEPPPGQDADPGVGVGEARLAGRDQHVAGQRQLEASRDGETVDGADDGQRARRERIDDARALPADGGADLSGALAPTRGFPAQLLQVEPRAEGAAAAGEDHHVDVAGLRQLRERRPQRLHAARARARSAPAGG